MADASNEVQSIVEIDGQISASWERFLASFADVSPSVMDEPGVTGEWSLKQLIGHVAYWDGRDVADFDRRSEGAVVAPADWQTENDAHGPALAERSVDEVLASLRDNHAVLVARLRALDANDPRTPDLGAELLAATVQHYDEHAAEIRAWKSSRSIS